MWWEGPGRVSGTVLNGDGQPVANANVCISTRVKPNNTMSMCNGVKILSTVWEMVSAERIEPSTY